VYEHKQEKMTGTSEIHGGKVMISPRPEADDYGHTFLGLVSCEGECDVISSTFTLFNDAVKLTRFLTTNYETNEDINTHKISPQIGHALMGFRRRSGLAEGLQSNNNISIVLTNAEWKKEKKGAWVSGRNEKAVTHIRRRYLTEKVVSRDNTSDVCGVFRVQISAHILSRPRWRSWLRHRYNRRKVAGSILHNVTGIFHEQNPSDRTMALGSIQPLAELVPGILPGG
jgi:hypothetical protein